MCKFEKKLTNLIYDAHCHFHLNESDESLSDLYKVAGDLSGFALMSTQANDWETTKLLCQKLDPITRYRNSYMLGIHPWFAHHYVNNDDWLKELEILLLEDQHAGVGEIGLDRKWKTPDTQINEYEAQLLVFQKQLELAAKLHRPVSIHCVHAQGALFTILRQLKYLPPKIYLHAFGGAPGTVEQLIRDRRFGRRLYFGFASCINLRSPKTKAVIAMVPEDRLLLESDRSSGNPSVNIIEELHTMLRIFAEMKSWNNLEEAAMQLRKNTLEFYSLFPSKL